jgi:hypothetical protein
LFYFFSFPFDDKPKSHVSLPHKNIHKNPLKLQDISEKLVEVNPNINVEKSPINPVNELNHSIILSVSTNSNEKSVDNSNPLKNTKSLTSSNTNTNLEIFSFDVSDIIEMDFDVI